MADKRHYNAKMNAKGLDASVSEEQARGMCLHQGSQYVLVVQVHAGPKVVDEDGTETISLIPDQVELVPGDYEDRVRDFSRALYLARPDQHGQEAFEGAAPGEPTVQASSDALDALVERDGEGATIGVWDGTADTDDLPSDGPACAFPGCVLPEEHDGDHEVPAEDDTDADATPVFSGKK